MTTIPVWMMYIGYTIVMIAIAPFLLVILGKLIGFILQSIKLIAVIAVLAIGVYVAYPILHSILVLAK
jgi:hypothetical protein